MKIIVYSRETSSGTYEFFKEKRPKKQELYERQPLHAGNRAVIQSVSQTKGAIGYVGLAYLSDRVKPIAVSYDEGKHYVLPTMEKRNQKDNIL